ncbi:Sodium-independent sulfate anion transporter [Lamellibrachia satsuma]|nr:Sodium-independent sulfate anion transporter [Lamellibrachia satsuma]
MSCCSPSHETRYIFVISIYLSPRNTALTQCDASVMNQRCRQCCSNTCTASNVKKKLPILNWLPTYSLSALQGDAIAGLTVALTVIPQGLAYASVAQLPPQYGLYSAFMGCFVYCIFGTAKDITLGPTAIMSLMTATFATSPVTGDATLAVVLTLMCGIVQFIMSVLHVGFLVNFISVPVMSSFVSSAAITIAFGQVPKFLGLNDIPRDFFPKVYWTCRKLPETNVWDLLLGFVSIVILFSLRRLQSIKWRQTDDLTLAQKVGRKTLWILATSRNAIVVVTASGVAALLISKNIDVFSQTTHVQPGLPPFSLPKFSIHSGNVSLSTPAIFKELGFGLAVVPLIGLIETIAIGKAFARKNNYALDANQELLAIGFANIVGSFVGSYPVTGSFSRTAVNSESGVRTPAGGIFTGCVIILALAVLTPLLPYIPTAALAAVIIAAVINMVHFRIVISLWRRKKIDLVPWGITFVFSFILGIEYGILLGVGVSLFLLLYPWARPKIKVPEADKSREPGDVMHQQVTVVQLSNGLMFPGVEYVTERVNRQALADGIPKSAILDFSHVTDIDSTALQGLQQLAGDFRKRDTMLVVSNAQPEVLDVLNKVDISYMKMCTTKEEAIQLIYDETEPSEDNPRQTLLQPPQAPPIDNIQISPEDV